MFIKGRRKRDISKSGISKHTWNLGEKISSRFTKKLAFWSTFSQKQCML
jgi:hypothetical protein